MRIKDALNDFNKEENIRFFMPGHSGKEYEYLQNIIKNDITELSFSDNLMYPSTCIKESENYAAKIFQVSYCLFVTQGASSCVYIALYAQSKKFKEIYVIGDAHKSLYSAAKVLGIKVRKYENNKNVGLVFITSPDYFGMEYNDLKNIILCLKSKGVKIILDASHAAHFNFSCQLPDSCVSLADITVLSLHKTLPTLTGAALLCVNNCDDYINAIKARYEIHSTSPSYAILYSIDNAIEYFDKYGEQIYDRIIKERVEYFSVDTDFYRVIKTDDLSRLVLEFKTIEIARYFKSKLELKRIFPEAIIDKRLIFIITDGNYKHLKKLFSTLQDFYLEDKNEYSNSENISIVLDNFDDYEYVALNDLLGRTVAFDVLIYPPARVIANAGSVIGERKLKEIIKHKDEIFSIINEKILCTR